MEMNKQKEWITIAELARRIERHYTRVHPKIKGAIERGEIKTKNGKIEYHATKAWWDAHTQTKHTPYRHRGKMGTSTSLSANGIPEIHQSQARKEAAMADLKELEAAEKRGKLIEKAKVIKTVFQCGRQVRDIFRAIPRRVSGVLATETDQRAIQTLLEEEIEKGLQVFEEVKL